jgi:seryl-tRNA synthetase
VTEVLELDRRRRTILPELESLRAAKNAASEEIAEAKRAGADAAEAIEAMRALGQQEKRLEGERAQVDGSLQEALSRLPNLPSEDAPQSDTVLKLVGEPRTGDAFLDHLELAGPLIDMEAGARLSGARFAYLRGDLVMLELALVRWALERLHGEGFEPVIPPVLVREQALYGTGMLPDTEQQIYVVAEDELYLAGTSEVALASLHAGEILAAEDLPHRRGRQGHPWHLPRPSVRQGRDVRLHDC